MLPVVIIVIGWLLSERYFPQLTIGYYPFVNYILGGIASVMLTVSILFHELGHAIMAVRSRLQIERIHLYLFGGMAELKHRPLTPGQEFLVAISGPFASFVLAGIFFASTHLVSGDLPLTIHVLTFLVHVNILLGLFNLIPIFPLDGGRALRALLWKLSGLFTLASRGTLYISIATISAIFIAGMADLILVDSGYQMILILLALYMAYTVWNGRKELMHHPTLQDLIFELDNSSDLPSLVRQISDQKSQYLSRTVIPVITNDSMQWIVRGRHLFNRSMVLGIDPYKLAEFNRDELVAEIIVGDYIDIRDENTFDSRIRYTADFVPVLESGRFLGLCDANEMRFWLIESRQKKQDL